MFYCDICSKEFANQKSIDGHNKIHGEGRYPSSRRKTAFEFQCLQCQKFSVCHIKSSTGKFCSNKCQGEYVWDNVSKPKIEEGLGGNLKRYLTETRGYHCECCSVNEWQGKPLTLHLDHIDGDSDNNDVSNVRLICPNCHSQTETYSGRNKKNSKRNRYLQTYKSTRKQSRAAR